MLLKKGNRNAAKKYLEKSIKINPKYLKAYSNLASIYVGEGNLKSAELFLKKSHKKDLWLKIKSKLDL